MSSRNVPIPEKLYLAAEIIGQDEEMTAEEVIRGALRAALKYVRLGQYAEENET